MFKIIKNDMENNSNQNLTNLCHQTQKQTDENDHITNKIKTCFNEQDNLINKLESLRSEIHEMNSQLSNTFEKIQNNIYINNNTNNNSNNKTDTNTNNIIQPNTSNLTVTNNSINNEKIIKLQIDTKQLIENLLIKFDCIEKKFHYKFNKFQNDNSLEQNENNTIETLSSRSSLSKTNFYNNDNLNFQVKENLQNKENTKTNNLSENLKSDEQLSNDVKKSQNNLSENCLISISDKNIIDKDIVEKNLNEENENLIGDKMDKSKLSYSPEEFFKAVMTTNLVKGTNMPSTSSSSAIAVNTNQMPSSNQSNENSQKYPNFLRSLGSVDDVLNKKHKLIINCDNTDKDSNPKCSPASSSSNTPKMTSNSFSYNNPEEFIKAVMINNPQKTTADFSAKNARIFEDFYKNKLQSSTAEMKQINALFQQSSQQSQLQQNKSLSESPSASSFQSAVDALSKIHKPTQKPIQHPQQQKQQQQQQIKQSTSSYSSPSSSTSNSNYVNHREEVKIRINRVKEKFAKFTMKNELSINQKHKNDNFDRDTFLKQFLREKNNQDNKISPCGSSTSSSRKNSCYNEIQSKTFTNKTKCQRESLSRSVSESGGSVVSLVDSQSVASVSTNNESTKSMKTTSKTVVNMQQQQNQKEGQQNVKENHENCTNLTQSADLMDDEKKLRKRRRRGKRGGSSNYERQRENEETEENNCNLLKLDYPHLNAESLLILDLLSLSSEERELYLIELAKQRKILTEDSLNSNSFELHPNIVEYRKLVLHTNKPKDLLNDQEKKRIRVVVDKITNRLQATITKKETPIKYFEDHVNFIITEGLEKDKIEEFRFPLTPKRERFRNYFKSPNFTKRLEKYAKKCVDAGLGEIIEGEIRINAKNNEQAFMKYIDDERDAMFASQLVRKYALHGDIVKAFVRKSPSPQVATTTPKTTSPPISSNALSSKDQDINSPNKTQNCEESITEGLGLAALIEDENIEGDDEDEIIEKIQPEKSSKGFVIQIVKEIHNRKCVGSFLSYHKGFDVITFVPRDMKLPVLKIYKENWPDDFKNDKLQNITDTLYAAKIIDWQNELCIGKILHPIGKCNELDSENKAILYQNNLNMEPYEEKFNEMFYGPLIVSEDEVQKRRDIRKECVFTIDPLTARDLDDALSCRLLSDGNYEIGVHISDVAYFLEENTELDKIVSERTTSVYMVNEVFHMLPKSLCFKCSLLPGEDKFAFSIFWIMDNYGNVADYYIKRTILNSCTQFAYEHAQQIIDNPNRIFTENDFPQIHNNFTVNDIVKRVKILNEIATNLRKRRFDNGALKINKPKLGFELDPDSGKPINYHVHELKTANFMIEEFMLLANQYIAKFIYDKYPKISILRRHDPPVKNVMRRLKERLSKLNLNFDITNSKTIYDSLQNLLKSSKSPDAMEICLAHLASKPMTRAQYFCSDNATEKDDFWHYALSIPIYTHFTSPIRRYPDVLVHRVLSAALEYTSPPIRTPKDLHYIAAICNEMKFNAKVAGEDSSNLYFKYFIESKKSVIFRAAILEIFSHSMEVILIETGHIIRIHFPRDNKVSVYKVTVDTTKIPYTAILTFNTNNGNNNSEITNDNVNDLNQPKNKITYQPVELKMFNEIPIEVCIDNKKLKGNFVIPPELKKQQAESKKLNKKDKKSPGDKTNLKKKQDTDELMAKKSEQNLKKEIEENDQETEKNSSKQDVVIVNYEAPTEIVFFERSNQELNKQHEQHQKD